jgi:preprotein translocase subunit YajC
MEKLNDRVIFQLIFMSLFLLVPNLAFAQSAAAVGLSSFGGIMPLVLIFVFFYLFLIRPQHKKTKEHQNLLNALKKDDKIITSGGLYGTVVSVKGDIVDVKISPEVCVQIVKQFISRVVTKEIKEQIRVPEVIKK